VETNESGIPEIGRSDVPAMNALLGRTFAVLDDGFVRPIDYLGSDSAVVQAARVSYGRGTKRIHEDRGLIRYLMRHRHTTPFEMCELKLHVRVPMDTWRQWIRHRTANVNEYSTRYSVAIDRAQKTKPDRWRRQSSTNRQGSAGYVDLSVGSKLSESEQRLQDFARAVYEERLTVGVSREQARKDLPLSTYTEAYWKIDLHNLLHFLALRIDDRAQAEIRAYAQIIGHEIVAKWVPETWAAFVDYQLDGLVLSRIEVAILKALVSRDADLAFAIGRDAGWFEWDESRKRWKANREREEFLNKARIRFDLQTDWISEPEALS